MTTDSLTTTTTGCSPFTSTVVRAMRTIYSESLADKSFDNTGLLLEAPFDGSKPSAQRNSVLLTIDLTTAVANEAIKRRDSVIVAYHPIIFRGLKSLTFADTQQRSLLRLAAEGISVYCPHTAVDAAVGGNADWLADIVTTRVPDEAKAAPRETKAAGLNHFPSASRMLEVKADMHVASERSPIHPHSQEKDAGSGRVVKYQKSQPVRDILQRIAWWLGSPHGFHVAIPQGAKVEDLAVTTVGICAGSGSSVIRGQDVDMIVTGEMSHHEVLAAIENGQVVVCLSHSNSERGYLSTVMKPKLLAALKIGWQESQDVEVSVSKQDRDPFGYYTVD